MLQQPPTEVHSDTVADTEAPPEVPTAEAGLPSPTTITPARTKYGKTIVRGKQAACGSCESLFTSTSGFVAHRRGSRCASDEDMRERGMVQRDDGAWALPGFVVNEDDVLEPWFKRPKGGAAES